MCDYVGKDPNAPGEDEGKNEVPENIDKKSLDDMNEHVSCISNGLWFLLL